MNTQIIIRSVRQNGLWATGRKAYRYLTLGTPQDWTQHLDIERGDTVIDAGAHIGQFTQTAAEKAGSNGTIIAIEPATENFEQLQDTADEFPMVQTKQAAVMDYNGEEELVLKQNPEGHSLLNGSTGDTETIPVRRLTDIYSSYGIDHINFLKIDIEGAETSVLADSEDVLANTDKVLVEANHTHYHDTYDKNCAQVEKILKDYGFTTKVTDNHFVYGGSDPTTFE